MKPSFLVSVVHNNGGVWKITSSLYSEDLNVTRSQCSGAALGCGGERHGCAANKSAATLQGFHVIVDQNLGGNVSRSLFKLRHGSESKRVQTERRDR